MDICYLFYICTMCFFASFLSGRHREATLLESGYHISKWNNTTVSNPTTADFDSRATSLAPPWPVVCWMTVASPGANRTPTLFAASASIASGVSRGLLTVSQAGLFPTNSILFVTSMGTSKMV